MILKLASYFTKSLVDHVVTTACRKLRKSALVWV